MRPAMVRHEYITLSINTVFLNERMVVTDTPHLLEQLNW